jgi:flagellin
MSLGVLNNLNAVYAENNLNNTSNSLSTVLQQLSSGSKINSGADDAAGLSLVDGLQANSQALMQSKTNASEGVGLLTVADGALSQVTSLLNRAVTLATEASNGTLNSSQDTAANQEYQSILSEVSNIGSTTTYNGAAVFGSNTNIYTGDSTNTGASVDDLNIRSLSSSNVGDTNGTMSYSNGTDNVFINLSNSTTGTNAAVTDSLGATNATTTIAVNYMTKGADGSAVSATANVSAGAGTAYANTAQGLISAINGSGLGITASFGTAAQAGSAAVAAANAAATSTSSTSASTNTGIIISGANIGAGTSNTAGTAGAGTGADGAGEVGTITLADTAVFGTQPSNSDTLTGTLNIVGSDGTTHNLQLGTANSTDTLANLASTINADGYGVTATVTAASGTNNNTESLVFTSADSNVTVSQTSLQGVEAVGGAGSAPVAALTGTPTAAGTTQATLLGTFSGTDTVGGTLTVGTSTIAMGTTETSAQLAAAINQGNYGIKASLDSAGTAYNITSTNSSITALTSASGTGTGITIAAPTGTGTGGASTSAQYYAIGISGSIADTTTAGGTPADSGTANVGIVADENGSTGKATISYSDAAGTSLSNTDLSNQNNAEAALTSLNTAITAVAAQDGYVGAQINTLNSVSSVISTQSENVTSAQNAVQATDYASATSNMSKYEILSQTGISALAQANSMQQEVTKLLQ